MPESDLSFRGCVISGYGTTAQAVDLPKPIRDFLGGPEYQGSLNVALEQPIRFKPERTVIPQEGRAYYWAAEINGLRCLISRGRGHPLHIVEVIATCRLRDELRLNDGSVVEIRVAPNLADDLTWDTRLIWKLFWGWGRTTWYASRKYRRLIGIFWLLRRRATQSPQYHLKLFRKARLDAVAVCHLNLTRDSKLRGGERQTEILIQTLSEKKFFKQRVVVSRRGPLAQRLKNTDNLEVLLARSRLAALFACRGVPLLHAHEAHAAQVAHAASCLWHSKYLITRRLTKPVGNWYNTAIYQGAQTVIALTACVEDILRKRFPGISISRIPDAWNPVSSDSEATTAVRAQFPGKFLVGHVGAMDSPEKGHEVLIQAAGILELRHPELQFVLLGSGKLEQDFRQQAEGITNVHFSGWSDAPSTWFGAFDLFVFPSLQESLGSSLLDAMRAGIPIIASSVGGIPEVVTEECGRLIPPGDPEALAKQIVDVYQSSELRQRMSQAGIERAKQYAPALIAQRHLDMYRSLGTIELTSS